MSVEVRTMDTFLDKLVENATTAGYKLYLVGGSVRDWLMEREIHDYDLTTDAPVPVIKTILEAAQPEALFTLGEKFGTISAIVDGTSLEITTFRAQDEADDGQTADQKLHIDLAHRDFTVNAIARDLHTGDIHDPFEGQLHIKHKLIQAVGDAEDRFREDPLRMLRAVRLAVQLGFFLERETKEAIKKLAPLLKEVAWERIGDELDKMLMAATPSEGIDGLDTLGLMPFTIPEILAMHEMERGAYHYKEVYPHTLKVLDRTPPDLVLRWAGLLHDVAKPATYGITDGEVHFFGHDILGARMARSILSRLKRPTEVIEPVVHLIAEHLRIGVYDESWTDGAVRRFIRETAPVTEQLFALSRADITSQRAQRVAAALARVDALYERCEQIKAQEDVEKLHSPLDGHDLMRIFGGSPGRWIGQIKDYLLGLVLDGALSQDDQTEGERLAREYVAQHPELKI
ncbi:MAG TPA: HDIG domain-containing protein [Chloroflexia bacterium]|nr:HDIG domain-containing protein [Chloroflexia bacterium]